MDKLKPIQMKRLVAIMAKPQGSVGANYLTGSQLVMLFNGLGYHDDYCNGIVADDMEINPSRATYARRRIEDVVTAGRLEEMLQALVDSVDNPEEMRNELDTVFSPSIVEPYKIPDYSRSEKKSGPLQPKLRMQDVDKSDKKVVFISYTWETQETPGHKEWVKKLADDLAAVGIEVLLDQNQRLGMEMNQFMADAVRRSDRILLICTPTFKRRSDDRENACGIEASMISNQLLRDIGSIKYIPIIRKGEPHEVMPEYLGNRNALMMRNTDNYREKLAALIDDIMENLSTD